MRLLIARTPQKKIAVPKRGYKTAAKSSDDSTSLNRNYLINSRKRSTFKMFSEKSNSEEYVPLSGTKIEFQRVSIPPWDNPIRLTCDTQSFMRNIYADCSNMWTTPNHWFMIYGVHRAWKRNIFSWFVSRIFTVNLSLDSSFSLNVGQWGIPSSTSSQRLFLLNLGTQPSLLRRDDLRAHQLGR